LPGDDSVASSEDKTEEVPAASIQLSQLVEQDDAPALGRPDLRVRQSDPALVWVAPEDATYRISIRDNQAGDRPTDALGFELSVSDVAPAFELIAYRPHPTNNPATARAVGSSLARGGTESIHLLALRQDGLLEPI